ncbi:MAG: SDR family oxidoreductase, partial [Alphaproteobacteria bacterium]|nr:SDR family oxidoreductase [Alphaproteobacteria bacterium]
YFKTEMNADFFDTDRGKAYIRTIPIRRLGQLDELDGPLLLLASEASSFINGTTLVVDGGHMVKSY